MSSCLGESKCLLYSSQNLNAILSLFPSLSLQDTHTHSRKGISLFPEWISGSLITLSFLLPQLSLPHFLCDFVSLFLPSLLSLSSPLCLLLLLSLSVFNLFILLLCLRLALRFNTFWLILYLLIKPIHCLQLFLEERRGARRSSLDTQKISLNSGGEKAEKPSYWDSPRVDFSLPVKKFLVWLNPSVWDVIFSGLEINMKKKS